ncbi:18 kDa coat protein [Cucumber mottle virus]|uniref:Capsid protein n=1 Tax=Cucumber mottle virus TaxID=388038 RepID=A0PA54_9VIRU|nr:18 kDa coat protein [Cucumber mottle virus]BAF37647.1 18 kDa coat protein [Cucumber mottle virus]
MAYSPITPTNLSLFSSNYVPFTEFYNYLVTAQGEAFQTQQGRDSVRDSLSGFFSSPVSPTVRFPDGVFYVFLGNPVLDPLFKALLQSLDTRNRVIEVDNPSNPTTAESLNAVQRTDDSTVSSRVGLINLRAAITQGNGVVNRSIFESSNGLTWATSGSSSSK